MVAFSHCPCSWLVALPLASFSRHCLTILRLRLASLSPPLTQDGIVFIDEIDKIVESRGMRIGGSVSSEGVQRDLLPIIEGACKQACPVLNLPSDLITGEWFWAGTIRTCFPSECPSVPASPTTSALLGHPHPLTCAFSSPCRQRCQHQAWQRQHRSRPLHLLGCLPLLQALRHACRAPGKDRLGPLPPPALTKKTLGPLLQLTHRLVSSPPLDRHPSFSSSSPPPRAACPSGWSSRA